MALEIENDKLENELDLQIKLDRIRANQSSSQENQRKLALILSVVEDNIDEQKNSRNPVAYFVSFLALLLQAFKDDQVIDQDLAIASSYFLDLILPFTPKNLLKLKFNDIFQKLIHVLINSGNEAPILKSSIGCLETLILAQDLNSWKTNSSVKKSLLALLNLGLDDRPKVRRRASDAVHKILSNPHPKNFTENLLTQVDPPKAHYASLTATNFILDEFQNYKDLKASITNNNKQNINNGNSTTTNNATELIHLLQLTSSITTANAWSVSKTQPLCNILLEIARNSDKYLVSTSLNVLTTLFQIQSSKNDSQFLENILKIIIDLKPSLNDTHLTGAWVKVLVDGISTYSKLSDPLNLIKLIANFIKILSNYLNSQLPAIYISASNGIIAILSNCLTEDLLLLPSKNDLDSIQIYEQVDDFISYLSDLLNNLLSVKYNHCTKEVLQIFQALLSGFKFRSNPDFLNPLKIVGDWRTKEQSNFDYNTETENVIATAIYELGPDVVLSILPLNLTNSSPDKPGRAWLLPLLRDNVFNSKLNYYIKEILPMTEFFKNKISTMNKSSLNIKVFETIIDQIWSLLPKFCDLPTDLKESFTKDIAQHLSSLLYSNPELRLTICNALKLLLNSNLNYSKTEISSKSLIQQHFPVSNAKENIQFLSIMANNFLSVLFNVYTQTASQSRSYVIETIDLFLQIISTDELASIFDNTCNLLQNALNEETKLLENQQKLSSNNETSRTSVSLLDLVVSMVKYVPESAYNPLFTIFVNTINFNDSLIQKRAYRIITKLSESETGKLALLHYISDIERVLIESIDSVIISAKPSRLAAINVVLDLLPKKDLFFIPSIVSDTILSTKDVNEKSRELSYSILIKMGKKMSEGGTVQNSKVPGFSQDQPDVEASLELFFNIVSAGLAANSQHMISATITSISCLVYEFQDNIPQHLLVELAQTIELFLTSKSKEIIKSAIGFVKIEVVSLPKEIIENNLEELLKNLMQWSHQHAGHIKSKVKHIVERLIRKFGYEVIEANIPEEDKKLIVNIKKSRARAKRKQQNIKENGEVNAESNNNGNNNNRKGELMSGYEKAIYDSEDSDEYMSDDEDEDEEEEISRKSRKSKKNRNQQYIFESKDEPLNLLDKQTLSHISSTKPKFNQNSNNSKRTPKDKFKTKEGKLLINEDGEDDDPFKDKEQTLPNGIDAYVDAIKSGPVRGQRNRFKYKKENRKSNDLGDEDMDASVEKKTKVNNKRFVGKGKISKGPRQQKFKSRRRL
ncbi:mRNA-binding protein RRP12 [Ascoidea rubescens DSM 1968]|uniref:NUC173-domain-containing protein n=1 Tax=Ascoidea rubescens DSM 1968 TaxID=1344418 RepID=A0A1D2VAP7_9ASCO|nr:NUC173-domain-containing protein [Ascoidea rubescens DSM 1968]ODV58661.1 NUC173-domain-containing protein [Ascoidea rubescens DSM 1968]